MGYTVAQNTSFYTAASVLQKVISFVYFTIIARIIGVGNTGEYFFAIAFTTIFTVAADFGLGPILTREVAKYPENSKRYLATVFWAKVGFGILAYALVALFINWLGYPVSTRHLVYLSGVTMFLDNLHSAFYSVFRGRKNLVIESAGIVGSQFLTLIIGSIALFNGWGLIWLIIAYTIPSFLNVLYSATLAFKFFGTGIGGGIDKQILRDFLKMSYPFALAGIIGRLYSYTDTIFISKILSKDHLGWWSVPYKITFAFQFIPAALSASVYPAMSALGVEARDEVGRLFEKSWRYLFTIVFPLSFGLIALSEQIIVKLYKPAFLPAVPVLRILMVSLIFGFLSFITGPLLNALNRQKTQTGIMASALVVNVIANIILLPRFGIVGAAGAALLGNLTLCFAGFYFVRREVPVSVSRLLSFALRAFVPAAVMGFSAYWLAMKINFILVIPAAAIFYFGLLFISGGLDMEMIRAVLLKVKRK